MMSYFDNPRAKLIRWHAKEFKCNYSSWTPRFRGPEIFFHEARQVLKRHNQGEPFGLPLSVLHRRFHFQKRLDLRGYDDLGFTDHFRDDVASEPTEKFNREQARKQAESLAKTKDAEDEKGGEDEEDDEAVESTDQDVPRTLWTFTHEYDAKVLEGEIFIRRRHRIVGPVISSDLNRRRLQCAGFARLLHGLELPVCKHEFCRSTCFEGQTFSNLLDEYLEEDYDFKHAEHLARFEILESVKDLRGSIVVKDIGRIPSSVTSDYLFRDTEEEDPDRILQRRLYGIASLGPPGLRQGRKRRSREDRRSSRSHRESIEVYDSDFISYPAMSRSCTKCCTNFTLAISGFVAQSWWALELVTYHNLGDCRSPTEGLWHVFNAVGSEGRCGYPPGVIRDRWYGVTKENILDDETWQQNRCAEKVRCYGRLLEGSGNQAEAYVRSRRGIRMDSRGWDMGQGGCVPFDESSEVEMVVRGAWHGFVGHWSYATFCAPPSGYEDSSGEWE
ncbi:uncharacterized protein PG986_004718 [Apiospora aurea]|uniref:Uncharacterized protein n=1 Tax=Apiospora aurea TaxID=335848 RepID=A0ABR1QNF1_9PEZI